VFLVDRYLNGVITKYMLSYMFRLELPIVRTSVYKEFWLLVCKICKFKIYVHDNSKLHT